MVIQSPERNWDRLFSSHPDHLAAGEIAIQAVYPDSRNAFAFEDLLKVEGLEPWRVREVWVMSHPNSDHFVDITETIERKLAALHAHESQTAHVEELDKRIREWGYMNAERAGFGAGKYAEVFKVINSD
jgi:LmbE family N-acetylglucosaminyl deacetylase